MRQPKLMEGQDDYVFRRSRTLTGSKSVQVTASAEGRGQLKTDRLRLHELKKHRSYILRLLGVSVLAAGVLSFLLINFVFTPQLVFDQQGSRQPDRQKYTQAILDYFADHPLERFGFALSPQTLESHMKREHTEVKAVRIDREWYGANVYIHIIFRAPLLSWSTGGQQFYVDDNGVAFKYNHFVEPPVTVTDQSGIAPTESGVVASSRFIRFLGRMVGALNGYGRGKVTSVIIPASTRQIDLKLEGRDYVIKTHIDRDPLQQAEDIANALAYFDGHTIRPEYVDVRVAHKAYYK